MSNDRDQAHWKCPDCLMPCYCVGAARQMEHRGCGQDRNRDGEYDT